MLGGLPVVGGYIMTPFQLMMTTRSVELSNEKMKSVLGIQPVSLEESVKYVCLLGGPWLSIRSVVTKWDCFGVVACVSPDDFGLSLTQRNCTDYYRRTISSMIDTGFVKPRPA
jgi:hypothetical protein